MAVISILEYIGVLQHLRTRKLYEEMPSHIVSQISHNDSSLTGLLHGRAADFAEVDVAVDVH